MISHGEASQDPFLTSQPLSLSSPVDVADFRRQVVAVCNPLPLRQDSRPVLHARVLDPSRSSNTTEYSEQAAEFSLDQKAVGPFCPFPPLDRGSGLHGHGEGAKG